MLNVLLQTQAQTQTQTHTQWHVRCVLCMHVNYRICMHTEALAYTNEYSPERSRAKEAEDSSWDSMLSAAVRARVPP